MPSAVPGSTAATGLPPFWVLASMPASSIRRSTPCIFMMPSNTASAPASRSVASTLRSIPAAKSGLALVMTMPLTASSPSADCTRSSSVCKPSKLSTFMDFSGTSQVIVATPSASVLIVKSVILCLPQGAWPRKSFRSVHGPARRRPEPACHAETAPCPVAPEPQLHGRRERLHHALAAPQELGLVSAHDQFRTKLLHIPGGPDHGVDASPLHHVDPGGEPLLQLGLVGHDMRLVPRRDGQRQKHGIPVGGEIRVEEGIPDTVQPGLKVDRRHGSDPLDDRRGPHARGDAQRGKARSLAGPLELVQQDTDDDRTGRAQRMAHRDAAAIDIDLAGI